MDLGEAQSSHYDLIIIGAGINGAGIARDAAGRGISVLILDKGDIAGATSSASTKLIHGGLRYLEHGALAMVAEALNEREHLQRIAPHLAQEQRFLIPPAPFARPQWLVRAGLFVYDLLSAHTRLEPSKSVRLDRDQPYGAPLLSKSGTGLAYSDLTVDDARLTLANVTDAVERGARFLPRTRFESATRQGGHWAVKITSPLTSQREVYGQALINAAGPWADTVRRHVVAVPTGLKLRLVQGSHIVVPRLYDGDHAYLLQTGDRRVVFTIPFEGQYTLVGTTEVPKGDADETSAPTPAEIEYLCSASNRYFVNQIDPGMVVWSFSGTRPLADDGAATASAVSREYRLILDGTSHEPPLLSVFGGKLTTYRRLSERVLNRLRPWFPALGTEWTASAPLPGGELGCETRSEFASRLKGEHPTLPATWVEALTRRHGSRASRVIGEAATRDDLGEYFGAGLYERELAYMIRHEWVFEADDALWRRSKCGVGMTAQQRERVAQYLSSRILHSC